MQITPHRPPARLAAPLAAAAIILVMIAVIMTPRQRRSPDRPQRLLAAVPHCHTQEHHRLPP